MYKNLQFNGMDTIEICTYVQRTHAFLWKSIFQTKSLTYMRYRIIRERRLEYLSSIYSISREVWITFNYENSKKTLRWKNIYRNSNIKRGEFFAQLMKSDKKYSNFFIKMQKDADTAAIADTTRQLLDGHTLVDTLHCRDKWMYLYPSPHIGLFWCK